MLEMMPNIFFVFIGGVLVGMFIAIVAMAILMPPQVGFQHLTLGEDRYNCLVWEEQIMCRQPTPESRIGVNKERN